MKILKFFLVRNTKFPNTLKEKVFSQGKGGIIIFYFCRRAYCPNPFMSHPFNWMRIENEKNSMNYSNLPETKQDYRAHVTNRKFW